MSSATMFSLLWEAPDIERNSLGYRPIQTVEGVPRWIENRSKITESI